MTIMTKSARSKNSTNSLIRQDKQTYYVKLGNILSNPQTGHKNFWAAFKRVTNKKKILIFCPLLITISLLPIFNIKLIYLTTILLTNATFTIMAALCRNFVPKQMHQYLSLTLLLTKLLILLRSIMLIKLTAMMEYQSLCFKYVRPKLLYHLISF